MERLKNAVMLSAALIALCIGGAIISLACAVLISKGVWWAALAIFLLLVFAVSYLIVGEK